MASQVKARELRVGSAILRDGMPDVIVRVDAGSVLYLVLADDSMVTAEPDETLTVAGEDDEPIQLHLADAVIDALYDQFGAMTGCPVEDTDAPTLAEALKIAAALMQDAERRGERIRCGTCGSRFGDLLDGTSADQCPKGCDDDVSWRRVNTPAKA